MRTALRSDKSEFKNYIRVSIVTIDYILKEIGEEIGKKDISYKKYFS